MRNKLKNKTYLCRSGLLALAIVNFFFVIRNVINVRWYKETPCYKTEVVYEPERKVEIQDTAKGDFDPKLEIRIQQLKDDSYVESWD